MFCALSSTLMLAGQILLMGGCNTSPDLQRRTITDGPSYYWCGQLLSKNSLQPLYLTLPWDPAWNTTMGQVSWPYKACTLFLYHLLQQFLHFA